MPRDDLRRMTEAFVEAFNNADWDRLRELFAPVVTHNLATPVGVREWTSDTDSTIAWLQEVKGGSPDLTGALADSGWIIDESKNTAIGTVTWTATTRNGEAEGSGILLVTVADAHISEIREYVNLFCPCCEPVNLSELRSGQRHTTP